MSLKDCSARARRLLSGFDAAAGAERWAVPFPLAVFGTLRAGLRNHGHMQRGRIQAQCRAFLPHFVARGLELYCRRSASAPFEVYFYDASDWHQVIAETDELEDFDPAQQPAAGYHRSLAWLRVLPAEFDARAYDPEWIDDERDLEIEPARWPEFAQVPCWVYSSLEQNRLVSGFRDTPIIWDGSAV